MQFSKGDLQEQRLQQVLDSAVVYQGGQFSPVSNGSLSRTLANGARSDCYEAAQAALNGENPVGNCLYFNSGSGKGIQIGNQHFY